MDAPWGDLQTTPQTTSKARTKFWAFIPPADPKFPK